MRLQDDDFIDNLSYLSKEELLVKCKELINDNHTLQSKLLHIQSQQKDKSKSKKKQHNQRPIDFNKYNKRHIAFKFLYLGWDYQGLASQENTEKTIEEELFAAFTKAKLIKDRPSANYSRCGRTDKGVSAFGQVIALDVRSSLLEDSDQRVVDETDQCCVDKKRNHDKMDLSYVKILNRLLPSDIRILAHAYVPEEFNARFSCKTRKYKYFFPTLGLDIQLMHEAGQKLVGEKDFRNFCKIDVGNNVNHFTRRIVEFEVKSTENSSLGVMEITGLAFLWHQVRCMAAVLLLIGLHHEKPEIIDFLLDVEKCPKRPQYGMASEIPLVLFDCHYDDVEWIYEQDTSESSVARLTQLWTQKAVQSAQLEEMMKDLKQQTNHSLPATANMSAVLPGYCKAKYKPLRERAVCEGLERHLEKQVTKRIKLEQRYQERLSYQSEDQTMTNT